MIQPITKLLTGLRARGVAVSTAEGIDAARAAEAVGIESRETLRLALRAALAKGRREQETFDEIFDSVFAGPALGGGKGPGEVHRRGERAGGTGRTPGGGGMSPPRRPPETFRPGGVRTDRPARRDDVVGRRPTPRPVESAQRMPSRQGRLRRVVSGAEARDRGFPVAPAGEAALDLMRRDLASPMTSDEERRLSDLLPRLLATIRMRPSRRWKRTTAGRVWLRFALRANVRYGGIPFVLPLRSRRARRSRVVLLVDVSYSVARSAALFLAIALRLLQRRRDVKVVLFVDRPVDATDRLRAWVRTGAEAPDFASPVTGRSQGAQPPTGQQVRPGGSSSRPGARRPGNRRGALPGSAIRPSPGGASFLSVLNEIPELSLEAPSDYGRAFWSLAQKRPTRGRDTVLILLGDGRVNRFDPQEWAFRELAEGCRRVIWLVPEPRERWGTGDSALDEYLPFCDVAVETADLEGIAAGIAELRADL